MAPLPAAADPDPSHAGPNTPAPNATSGASKTSFWTHLTKNASKGHHPTGTPAEPTPVVAGGELRAEDCTDFTSDQQTNQAAGVTYCTPEETDAEKPEITISDIQKAFGELKLDPGVLNIEPPDHVTLVNFDTNFFTTTTEPVTAALTLLGQAVTLEATPSAYQWSFGDGQTLRTTNPGAPYPALDVTHNYLQKGDYLPALSTTYSGRFKTGDGAWQTIPGTVTIEGTGQTLRAIEASPKLVGY